MFHFSPAVRHIVTASGLTLILAHHVAQFLCHVRHQPARSPALAYECPSRCEPPGPPEPPDRPNEPSATQVRAGMLVTILATRGR